MRTMMALIKRNIKLFFNDKGMFLTSLITPLILLLLYITFLGNIYKQTFLQNIPENLMVSEAVIDALVAGQLMSSILAVSCVTVAFSANFVMVQDKALGNIKDLTITPVKSRTLSMSYYFASWISTMIVCFVTAAVCLLYIALVGWYISFSDFILILADVFLLVLFGTVLSSLVNCFLSTQGQISAVGTIVGSCYGFICGAYMPIASFNDGLQNAVLFLPGTYGTSLLRNHTTRGAFLQLKADGAPEELIKGLQDAIDCNLYFSENKVSEAMMFIILGISIIVLIILYVLIRKYVKSK